MSFKLEYFSPRNEHIVLSSGGEVSITFPNEQISGFASDEYKEITLGFKQSQVLKAMVKAQDDLERLER